MLMREFKSKHSQYLLTASHKIHIHGSNYLHSNSFSVSVLCIVAYLSIRVSGTDIGYGPRQHYRRKSRIDRSRTAPCKRNQFRFHCCARSNGREKKSSSATLFLTILTSPVSSLLYIQKRSKVVTHAFDTLLSAKYITLLEQNIKAKSA